MKFIYQLKARGNSINGWKFNMNSKKVFLSMEAAEKYIQEFTEKCTDDNEFEYADINGLKVTVLELELQE